MANFERKILRRIFGVTKIDNIRRKKYNRGSENIFGDLYFVSFKIIIIIDCKKNGHVKSTDVHRISTSIFIDKPQGNRLMGRPKNLWWNNVKCIIFSPLFCNVVLPNSIVVPGQGTVKKCWAEDVFYNRTKRFPSLKFSPDDGVLPGDFN